MHALDEVERSSGSGFHGVQAITLQGLAQESVLGHGEFVAWRELNCVVIGVEEAAAHSISVWHSGRFAAIGRAKSAKGSTEAGQCKQRLAPKAQLLRLCDNNVRSRVSQLCLICR